jgi:hypothetical protein
MLARAPALSSVADTVQDEADRESEKQDKKQSIDAHDAPPCCQPATWEQENRSAL